MAARLSASIRRAPPPRYYYHRRPAGETRAVRGRLLCESVMRMM